MDFIQSEAIDESQQNEPHNFSDDDEKTNDEMDDFIDDSEQPMEDVSFYRKLDPGNIDNYIKFPNQTRNPRVAVYEVNEMFFGTKDTQPELLAPKNRENVEFDKFEGYEKSVKKFMNAFQNVKTARGPFFIQ